MITISQFHLLSLIFEQAAPPLWECIHFEMEPICIAKAWYDANIPPVNVLFCLNFFYTNCSQAERLIGLWGEKTFRFKINSYIL